MPKVSFLKLSLTFMDISKKKGHKSEQLFFWATD